ncbi:MAG: glycosyltransferase family 39 protein, partial [Gemmataceae bacterium]|nr:glycosyltransferase family 39 protein [Gemmataceae bacterium]
MSTVPPPDARRPPSWLPWAIAAVVVVGLVARVGLASVRGLSAAPEPGTDQHEYDTYAWNLAQGHGYRGMSPDVADPNHLTAYRPPLPSVAMAAVYAVAGHSYTAVRLLHCLLGAGSVWLTYRLGRRAYGETVGLVAAAGYAVYPLAVFQSGDILSEPLGVFLFLLFLDLALAAGGSWRHACGAGAVLGLALLARANYALMLPLLVVWALFQARADRRLLWRAGAVVAVAAAVMVP